MVMWGLTLQVQAPSLGHGVQRSPSSGYRVQRSPSPGLHGISGQNSSGIANTPGYAWSDDPTAHSKGAAEVRWRVHDNDHACHTYLHFM